LDGWWAEACAPDVGWALGDGQDRGDDPAGDESDAEALYTLLERDVIPEFYARDAGGVPTAWVARMRNSMARLTPRFSASRAVREYTEKYYVPGASAYLARADDKAAIAADIVGRRRALNRQWPNLRFGEVKVETEDDRHLFDVEIYIGDLDPESVRVELYADGGGGGVSVRQEMARVGHGPGPGGTDRFHAAVAATRPASDYTVRAIPRIGAMAVPLEDDRVLWQR
jgi:starch phosphorylase